MYESYSKSYNRQDSDLITSNTVYIAYIRRVMHGSRRSVWERNDTVIAYHEVNRTLVTLLLDFEEPAKKAPFDINKDDLKVITNEERIAVS